MKLISSQSGHRTQFRQIFKNGSVFAHRVPSVCTCLNRFKHVPSRLPALARRNPAHAVLDRRLYRPRPACSSDTCTPYAPGMQVPGIDFVAAGKFGAPSETRKPTAFCMAISRQSHKKRFTLSTGNCARNRRDPGKNALHFRYRVFFTLSEHGERQKEHLAYLECKCANNDDNHAAPAGAPDRSAQRATQRLAPRDGMDRLHPDGVSPQGAPHSLIRQRHDLLVGRPRAAGPAPHPLPVRFPRAPIADAHAPQDEASAPMSGVPRAPVACARIPRRRSAPHASGLTTGGALAAGGSAVLMGWAGAAIPVSQASARALARAIPAVARAGAGAGGVPRHAGTPPPPTPPAREGDQGVRARARDAGLALRQQEPLRGHGRHPILRGVRSFDDHDLDGAARACGGTATVDHLPAHPLLSTPACGGGWGCMAAISTMARRLKRGEWRPQRRRGSGIIVSAWMPCIVVSLPIVAAKRRS